MMMMVMVSAVGRVSRLHLQYKRIDLSGIQNTSTM